MIAKIFAAICLLGLVRAGSLYGGYSGYGGYDGYNGYAGYAAVAPAYSYSAPVVAKAIVPAYAPAVSHVSQYSVHSSPIVKSYAPVSYGYSPYSAYASPLSYDYGSYGYGGYGSKYAW